MEKLDYLRWYTGDIRNRDENGYLISSNDLSLYKTKSTIFNKITNMFLYPDMFNEYERTKNDDKYLPPINEINDVLRMYDSIVNLASYVYEYAESIYRIDRMSTINLVNQLGYNPSFFSCSKEHQNEKFFDKNAPILIKLNIKNSLIVDMSELLGNEYISNDEREIIILPFHKLSIVSTNCYNVEFDNKILEDVEAYDIEYIKERVVKEENVNNVNNIINRLNSRKELDAENVKKYIEWKNDLTKYIKYILFKKYTEEKNRRKNEERRSFK